MKRRVKASLIALALSLFACPNERPATTSSSATTAAGQGASAVPSAERVHRADRIRDWFSQRAKQEQSRVVATTRTESGQIIDWIRPQSQLPPGATLAAAPPLTKAAPPPNMKKITASATVPGAERYAQTEVQVQPKARGPEG